MLDIILFFIRLLKPSFLKHLAGVTCAPYLGASTYTYEEWKNVYVLDSCLVQPRLRWAWPTTYLAAHHMLPSASAWLQVDGQSDHKSSAVHAT
jgi:hypothetical protein